MCRAQKAVAEEGASDKQLKSEAKEVWKLLKKFKVTPANLSLSQEELRQKVESIPSREPPVNGKLAAEISDKWKTYAEMCASSFTRSTESVCNLCISFPGVTHPFICCWSVVSCTNVHARDEYHLPYFMWMHARHKRDPV